MGNKESFGSSEWHLEGHGFCHAQVVARLELVQCFFYTETGLREKCNLSSHDLVSTNLNAHSSPGRKIWFYRQFLPGLSKSKISSRHQHQETFNKKKENGDRIEKERGGRGKGSEEKVKLTHKGQLYLQRWGNGECWNFFSHEDEEQVFLFP